MLWAPPHQTRVVCVPERSLLLDEGLCHMLRGHVLTLDPFLSAACKPRAHTTCKPWAHTDGVRSPKTKDQAKRT
jgi:hypothetical protein